MLGLYCKNIHHHVYPYKQNCTYLYRLHFAFSFKVDASTRTYAHLHPSTPTHSAILPHPTTPIYTHVYTPLANLHDQLISALHNMHHPHLIPSINALFLLSAPRAHSLALSTLSPHPITQHLPQYNTHTPKKPLPNRKITHTHFTFSHMCTHVHTHTHHDGTKSFYSNLAPLHSAPCICFSFVSSNLAIISSK